MRVQVIRQGLFGDNAWPLAHQGFKQAVLKGGEFQRHIPEPHRLAQQVDAQRTQLEHIRSRFERAPQQSLDTRCQLRVFERLDEIVVGTRFQPLHLVLPAAARSKNENRYSIAGLAQALHDAQAI